MGNSYYNDKDFVHEDFGAPIQFKFKKPGDSIIGRFVGMKSFQDSENKYFTVIILDTGNGEMSSIGGAYLVNQFERYPAGVVTKVTYKNDIDTGQPSPMKNFTIEMSQSDKALVAEYANREDDGSPSQETEQEELPF